MEVIDNFRIVDWNIEAMTGYKPISTFYTDFSIADNFGATAIMDTYTRATEEWKNDYKMLTELVMVLNWKIWEHNDRNQKYARLYTRLYEELDRYAIDTLKGEELSYFFSTTD